MFPSSSCKTLLGLSARCKDWTYEDDVLGMGGEREEGTTRGWPLCIVFDVNVYV